MKFETKNHKDTVFRMLYRDKRRLLELYNAINHTNYKDPSKLIIKTMKGMTFLEMKNDVSFLFDFEINLYEHNSTPCPNIPLRYLFYIAASYRNLISLKDTYKSEPISIPLPRFFVFYNGTAPLPDQQKYRLSDMFAKKTSSPSLELVATLININEGRSKDLMDACKTLKEYSQFVAKVRKYTQEAKKRFSKADYKSNRKVIIESAVTRAIDECIKEDILRDFFIAHRKEAIDMSILECTAEEQMQVFADESFDKGQAITNAFYSWLFENGRVADAQKAASDKKFFQKLYKEYQKAKSDEYATS